MQIMTIPARPSDPPTRLVERLSGIETASADRLLSMLAILRIRPYVVKVEEFPPGLSKLEQKPFIMRATEIMKDTKLDIPSKFLISLPWQWVIQVLKALPRPTNDTTDYGVVMECVSILKQLLFFRTPILNPDQARDLFLLTFNGGSARLVFDPRLSDSSRVTDRFEYYITKLFGGLFDNVTPYSGNSARERLSYLQLFRAVLGTLRTMHDPVTLAPIFTPANRRVLRREEVKQFKALENFTASRDDEDTFSDDELIAIGTEWYTQFRALFPYILAFAEEAAQDLAYPSPPSSIVSVRSLDTSKFQQ